MTSEFTASSAGIRQTRERGRRSPADSPSSSQKVHLAFWVLVALADSPLLLQLGRRMWLTEHYQFFPLTLVGAAFLGYRRAWKTGPYQPGRTRWRILLSGGTVLVLAMAILLDSPWLGGVAAMTGLWSAMYCLGGRPLLQRCLPAWLFLWLAIPLPLGLDQQLILALQRLATKWASSVLDLFGYRHVVAGVVIEMPDRSYMVEEACSGIHSLFAAITCAVFYSIYSRRGVTRTLLLVTAAAFWVLVANACRVTAVPILRSAWNLPVTTGIGHQLLGILVFALALVLVVSTDRLGLFLVPLRTPSTHRRERVRSRWWQRILGRSKKRPRSSAARRDIDSPPVARTSDEAPRQRVKHGLPEKIEAITLPVLLVLLFGAHATSASRLGDADRAAVRIPILLDDDRRMLPEEMGGWTVSEYQRLTREQADPLGAVSRTWQLDKSQRSVLLSIDGPFVGWHALGNCLQGQGWQLLASANRPFEPVASTPVGQYTEMELAKGLGQFAFVVYTVFDARGRPVTPPESYVQFRAVRRFPNATQVLDRLFSKDKGNQARDGGGSFQVQLFAESAVELSEEERDEIRKLFCRITAIVTEHKESQTAE